MRIIVFGIVLLLAVLVSAIGHVVTMKKQTLNDGYSEFSSWALKHGRGYNNQEEIIQRLDNYMTNRKAVEEHNQKTSSWQMGLNKFSDMTFEEFSSFYLMAPQNCSATQFSHKLSGQDPPAHKDWRLEGDYVTPVKNQGECGSCWTFSTTGCLESATAIHGRDHPLYSLSEQQLVDCAQAFNNHGCSGGLPSQAFEYIHYNKGLMSEEDYPYTAKDGNCKFDSSKAVAFVKEVVNITQGSETELTDAIAFKNPVSVAFQVTDDFMQYKSGVYSNPSCGNLPSEVNHAVLAVGYGIDSETVKNYYIIKNSWGSDWGMNGYFMMERGVNMCGVADCASYPIV